MKQEKLSEKTEFTRFFMYEGGELTMDFTMLDVLNKRLVDDMPILHKLLEEDSDDVLFGKLIQDINFLSRIDLEQTEPIAGDTLLHWASQKHYELACALIDAGANVNAKNKDNDIPLFRAIHYKDDPPYCNNEDREKSKNLMKKLLDNGSNPLQKGFMKTTPLFNLAVQHPDFIKTYLDYIDLNNKNNIEIIKKEYNKIDSENQSLIKKPLEQKMLEQQFQNNETNQTTIQSQHIEKKKIL